jgi:hypothetical protein
MALVAGGAAGAVAQERQVGAKAGPSLGRLAVEPVDDEDYRRRLGLGQRRFTPSAGRLPASA